jgi:hypothetical protein
MFHLCDFDQTNNNYTSLENPKNKGGESGSPPLFLVSFCELFVLNSFGA